MRLPALLTFATLLQGCNDKDPLVTTEPGRAEISGRYELSRSAFGGAIDSQIKTKAASAYIELRKDGSLTFSEVPVVPDTGGSTLSLQKFHSGSGTYSIAPLGSTAKSEFYGLHIDCGDLPDPMNAPRLRASGGPSRCPSSISTVTLSSAWLLRAFRHL